MIIKVVTAVLILVVGCEAGSGCLVPDVIRVMRYTIEDDTTVLV